MNLSEKSISEKFRTVWWNNYKSNSRQLINMTAQGVCHVSSVYLNNISCGCEGEVLNYTLNLQIMEHRRNIMLYDRINYLDLFRKLDEEHNYSKLLWK